MKVAIRKERLPTDWSAHPKIKGLVSEADLSIIRGSRLRFKLLVFKNEKSLANFWTACLGKGSLGKGCLGAVNSLAIHYYNPDTMELKRIEVDGRYFAICGLVQSHMSMEVICHESAHIGFAYYARTRKKTQWSAGDSLDEEEICYPSGRAAAAINRHLHKNDLYPA